MIALPVLSRNIISYILIGAIIFGFALTVFGILLAVFLKQKYR